MNLNAELAIEAYLESDNVVDWAHPEVTARSRAITAGIIEETSRARALFEWVRDAIPHTRDAGREDVTCSASEVLAAGTGICYAKAHLLAGLLRATGIPAGFCYQYYFEEESRQDDKRTLHGLNGVYLAGPDRWVLLDARGNKPGVNAGFDVDRPRLAFPDDPMLSDTVYARPLPSVVAALRSAISRTALWPMLPTVSSVETSLERKP
ncbi:MAG: transglutaminase-like domain-containing protein [Capsulimonadaceae bacterium]